MSEQLKQNNCGKCIWYRAYEHMTEEYIQESIADNESHSLCGKHLVIVNIEDSCFNFSEEKFSGDENSTQTEEFDLNLDLSLDIDTNKK